MFRTINECQIDGMTRRMLEYEDCRFYGPAIMIFEKIPIEGYHTIEPISETYKVEDCLSNIGINSLMEKLLKEYFVENEKVPFYVKTKFGDKVLINSENTKEVLDEYKSKLIIF